MVFGKIYNSNLGELIGLIVNLNLTELRNN